MALADAILIPFDDQRIELRPTLRAAMRLERRFGGFDKILKGLVEQNVGVMYELVNECTDRPCDLADFLAYDERKPMAYKVTALVAPLVALTMQLAGVDEDDFEADAAEGERIPYAEHFERLFKIGTGYLSWTPETTWNATPAEIKAAYEGRLEMLKAIYGTGDKDGTSGGSHDDPSTGIAILKAMTGDGRTATGSN
jgi:hypothetical protein